MHQTTVFLNICAPPGAERHSAPGHPHVQAMELAWLFFHAHLRLQTFKRLRPGAFAPSHLCVTALSCLCTCGTPLLCTVARHARSYYRWSFVPQSLYPFHLIGRQTLRSNKCNHFGSSVQPFFGISVPIVIRPSVPSYFPRHLPCVHKSLYPSYHHVYVFFLHFPTSLNTCRSNYSFFQSPVPSSPYLYAIFIHSSIFTYF